MENWFYELSSFMEAIFWKLVFFLFWIVSGLKSKPSRKASVHIRLSRNKNKKYLKVF